MLHDHLKPFLTQVLPKFKLAAYLLDCYLRNGSRFEWYCTTRYLVLSLHCINRTSYYAAFYAQAALVYLVYYQ